MRRLNRNHPLLRAPQPMITNEEARLLGSGDAEAIMAIRMRLGTQPGGPNCMPPLQPHRTVHDLLRDECLRMIADLRTALTPEERATFDAAQKKA